MNSGPYIFVQSIVLNRQNGYRLNNGELNGATVIHTHTWTKVQDSDGDFARGH